MLLFYILISGPLAASADGGEGAEYFALDPLTDGLLLTGGLGLNAGDIAIEKISEPAGGWILDAVPELSGLKPFDLLCVLPYSDPIDSVSDIFTYAALLAPAALIAAPVSEWLIIGTMYAESVIWTWGLKELGKNLIPRNRPYMYFDGYPREEIAGGDFQQSFPSGHTSLAFTGAGFCTFVFGRYFEDSPWKIPVIAASYTLAVCSAILRVASGSHFITDVIAGAAIGTLSGFIVPWLHTLNSKPSRGAGHDGQTISVAVAPSGINVKLSL